MDSGSRRVLKIIESGTDSTIGVGLLFDASGGGVAVAGEDDSVIGESEQFLANSGDELLLIATRKVAASDASFKENVTSDNDVGCELTEQVDDVSGTMAGDVKDLEGHSREFQDVTFADELIGGGAGDRGAGESAEVQDRVSEHRSITLPDDERDFGIALDHRPISGDVIGMPMCQQYGDGVQALSVDEPQDFLGFQAGVDDDAIASSAQVYDQGVLHEHGRKDDLNLET